MISALGDALVALEAVPKVVIAATIWFSVRDDVKMPTAMKAAPMRSRPR